MTFSDIFTDSFIESTSSLTTVEIIVTIGISFLVGWFIFQIYKRTYQSVVFTKSFSTSLIMMTMITSLVIMAVTSNIVLSLGMVGALSIVRFRAAIKDPMDIVFMFWAIASGIVVGAGFYLLAGVGTLVIGVILYIFNLNSNSDASYLLVVSFGSSEVEGDILTTLKNNTDKYIVRSKTIQSNQIELTIECRLKDNELDFVNDINRINTVQNALLVSNNEFAG